jgi:5'-3' exonuclease
VIVGWDKLDVATERHEKFPSYQSGREFDDALVEQLEILPEFVAACGFKNAKAPGYEADDFLAAAVAAEKNDGAMRSSQAVTATLSSSLPITRQFFTQCEQARWHVSGQPRYGSGMD